MDHRCRCGLPKTHLNLSAHYCETCFGYVAFGSMHRQPDGDTVDTLWSTSQHFGPFDHWDDVSVWLWQNLLDPSRRPPA
jgi:hypothetical protein